MTKTQNSARKTNFSVLIAFLIMTLFAASSCTKNDSVQPPATITANQSKTNPLANYIKPNKIDATNGSGPLFTSNKYSAPIYMFGQNYVTISDLTIDGGNASCIKLTNCSNVYITRCRLGNSKLMGVELFNCKHVVIENNYIYNVASGVVAYSCPEGGIMVYSNQMRNMQGPLPRGAFVQYANVGGTQNAIGYNKLQNDFGRSYPEDAINLYKTYGTPASPVQVIGNWIRGGGPSATGGGINLGEQGGAYQIAQDNILVDPGQYGIGISGGHNISVLYNKIYGKQQSFTNVGMLCWDQSGLGCYSLTATGNQVNFSSGRYGENEQYVGGNTSRPSGWDNNYWGAPLNESLLPYDFAGY